MRSVTDPEPEGCADQPGADQPGADQPGADQPGADQPGADQPGAETPEQKRARVMARLAEIIRGDPPEVSGSGPVTTGGFPALPSNADEFDQEKAAELFATLSQFFEQVKKPDPRR